MYSDKVYNILHSSFNMLLADSSLSSPSDAEKEFIENEEPETLEGVHLMFDSEAADLLPMVIR